MSGYDLLVSYGAPGDQIRINAQDLGPWFGNQIETLVYGDGTSISLTGGLSIIGSAGDDTLNGTAYNDTLQGGAGNDTLNGGGGNDIYVFNQGDGSDVINEAGGSDTLQLGPGLTAANVTFYISGNDLLIRDGIAGDQVKLSYQYNGSGYQVETLVYGDSTSFSLTGGPPIVGSSGNDTLNGTSYADTLQGLAANDVLNRNGGHEHIHGGPRKGSTQGG